MGRPKRGEVIDPHRTRLHLPKRNHPRGGKGLGVNRCIKGTNAISSTIAILIGDLGEGSQGSGRGTRGLGGEPGVLVSTLKAASLSQLDERRRNA